MLSDDMRGSFRGVDPSRRAVWLAEQRDREAARQKTLEPLREKPQATATHTWKPDDVAYLSHTDEKVKVLRVETQTLAPRRPALQSGTSPKTQMVTTIVVEYPWGSRRELPVNPAVLLEKPSNGKTAKK